MFGRKKSIIPDVPYDKQIHRAVIRSSICTGEQVIGFKDINTGKFMDVMVIRGDKDIEAFKKKYGIDNVSTEY